MHKVRAPLMPIRFASSHNRISGRLPRQIAARMAFRPANDNRSVALDNTHLRAALLHFADHGLGAAQNARLQAIKAAEAGDRQTFEWWLEICRALDRRMAATLDTRVKA